MRAADGRLRREGLEEPRFDRGGEGGPSGPLAGAGNTPRVAAREFAPVERLAKKERPPPANLAQAGFQPDVPLYPVTERIELEESLHEDDLVEHDPEHKLAEFMERAPTEGPGPCVRRARAPQPVGAGQPRIIFRAGNGQSPRKRPEAAGIDAQMAYERVREQADDPPVAVAKRMNPCEPVVARPDGDNP